MGYQVYEDRAARDLGVERWAGYGVPAICDAPDCTAEIDRGMGYRCEWITNYDPDREDEDSPNFDPEYDGDEVEGCNMHFCADHEQHEKFHNGVVPKPDTPEWMRHVLTDESWAQWRAENPDGVARYEAAIRSLSTRSSGSGRENTIGEAPMSDLDALLTDAEEAHAKAKVATDAQSPMAVPMMLLVAGYVPRLIAALRSVQVPEREGTTDG